MQKALRLFQHADELGLDDFDLGYRLAESLQKVGRTEEALSYYHAFAEKCVGQFRIDPRQAVSVGCDAAQDTATVRFSDVHVDAVQVIAGLFRGNCKL